MTYQSIVKYSDVKELEIADGLKELLIDYGFIVMLIVIAISRFGFYLRNR